MSEDIKNEKFNQLLIIGNGFDLACGLKSRYKDFFKWRFEQLFGKKVDPNDVINELLKDSDVIGPSNNNYYSKFYDFWYGYYRNVNLKKDCYLTRWDYMFLIAKNYLDDVDDLQWQDIENIIYNVVSIILENSGASNFTDDLIFKNKIRDTKENFEKEIRRFTYTEFINTNDVNYVRFNTRNTVVLLNELKKFERIFAKYIGREVKKANCNGYSDNAVNLVKKLLKSNPARFASYEVLSFNYSLDERFRVYLKGWKRINIDSWSNIHGIAEYDDKKVIDYLNEINPNNRGKELPAPIFGIDNHEILEDKNKEENDPRIIFTKPYRLIDNRVNSIRKTSSYKNLDLITIYGHSLGEADYSYFETIFDDCNLYHSKTIVQFYCYCTGKKEDKVEDQIGRRKYIKSVVNLLTDYGQTLSEKHGENIVNKMILENRLEVLPSSEVDPKGSDGKKLN